MLEKENVCLRHGGGEFWLIDPQRESAKEVRAGGQCTVHHVGTDIESDVLVQPIKVAEIFIR